LSAEAAKLRAGAGQPVEIGWSWPGGAQRVVERIRCLLARGRRRLRRGAGPTGPKRTKRHTSGAARKRGTGARARLRQEGTASNVEHQTHNRKP
jgi:hypothetical protein